MKIVAIGGSGLMGTSYAISVSQLEPTAQLVLEAVAIRAAALSQDNR